MKTFFICLFCLVIHFSFAQNQVLPMDASVQNSEFHQLYIDLSKAVEEKNSQFLLNLIDDNIEWSFGAEAGKVDFIKNWKLPNANSEIWVHLKKILKMGAAITEGGDFVFPSVYYSNQLGEYSLIAGDQVNVRKKADVNSSVVGVLTYEKVNIISDEGKWSLVETLDKKVKGYVYQDLIYVYLDYRMFMTKKNGKWKIASFIAGD